MTTVTFKASYLCSSKLWQHESSHSWQQGKHRITTDYKLVAL